MITTTQDVNMVLVMSRLPTWNTASGATMITGGGSFRKTKPTPKSAMTPAAMSSVFIGQPSDLSPR